MRKIPPIKKEQTSSILVLLEVKFGNYHQKTQRNKQKLYFGTLGGEFLT